MKLMDENTEKTLLSSEGDTANPKTSPKVDKRKFNGRAAGGFTKGNKAAVDRGKKQVTYLKKLKKVVSKIKSVNDLEELTLMVFYEGLVDTNKKVRQSTANTLAKYLFSTKKESVSVGMTFEEYLRQLKEGKRPAIPERTEGEIEKAEFKVLLPGENSFEEDFEDDPDGFEDDLTEETPRHNESADGETDDSDNE